MLPRKTASIALVLLLTASSFAALLPASGPRAGSVLTVAQEWQSGPYNETPGMIVNDTDGDGHNELVLSLNTYGFGPGKEEGGEHWIKVYDLPNYTLAWNLDLDSSFQLELVDAAQNGSVQFLLTMSDENGTWFELYSGKGYQKLWTSPHFADSFNGRSMVDVDADKAIELVFANGSMVIGDKMNFTFEYRLHVFDLKAGKADWESPALAAQVNDIQIANIDGDAADELLVFLSSMDENFSSYYGLSVYDGASHALQWKLPVDMNLTWLDLVDTGDLDGDRTKEVLLDTGWTNETGSSGGFLILSGDDGSAEWRHAVQNASFQLQTADIDNDTRAELLATEMVLDENRTSNTTFRIFDLKTHAELWSLGPFESSMYGNSAIFMTAADLTGDGVPEVLILNVSYDRLDPSYTYKVFDGGTLKEKWQSPWVSGKSGKPSALDIDSDSVCELVVGETWTDSDGADHGIVHVISTDSWTEEWASGDYLALIDAMAQDAVNDSRPEMLVVIDVWDAVNSTTCEKLQLVDPVTHAVIWTSPVVPSVYDEFVDLYGSPKNEIVFLVAGTNEYGETLTSQLLVFNDTDYGEAWRSEEFEGSGYPEPRGDFDNDGRGELLFPTTDYNERIPIANILVFEFFEEPLRYVDLAVQTGDLSLSNATPMAGTRVTLTARVHNLGDAAAGCATVALSLDGTQIDSTVMDIPANGTIEVNFTWAARVGDHMLAVRLDPRNEFAEPDETNNNASVSVSVARPPKPVAVITSPTEGQEIPEGRNITFDCSGSFVPEGGGLSWFSEQDGFLGSAPVFNATLPLGDHYVTLYVDDGQNNVSATVNFTVTPPPPPPGTTWAIITSPRNGAIFNAEDVIGFDGSKSIAAEPGYDLTFEWSSSLGGHLGNLSRFSMALASGSHNITLRVDDGHGGVSNASVNIRVREAITVKAVITSPAEGQSFEVTQNIQFDGSASTGPAGAILSYLWSSNLSGPLNTQKTFSVRLAPGAHAITLSVSDGAGHNGSATVNIAVRRSQDYRPTVTITSQLNGSTVSGLVTINGTSWDDLQVSAVFLRIDNGTWEPVTGTVNWLYRWNTNTTHYPNGQHRITVRASDGGQNSEEVTIYVTVNNANPPQPPIKPPEEKTDNTMLLVAIGIVAVVAVVGVAAFLVMRKK